jgi:hypothetical protein
MKRFAVYVVSIARYGGAILQERPNARGFVGSTWNDKVSSLRACPA